MRDGYRGSRRGSAGKQGGRSRMSISRTIWIFTAVALASTALGLAAAQQVGGNARQPARAVQPAAEPQPPQMEMRQLLGLWEGQSAKLQTLELAMYRIDIDPKWGDEEHYFGRAAFKSPQLAYLDFRKVKMQEQADPKDKRKKKMVPVKKDNKPVSVSFETIICTDQEVWQYRYDVRKIYIFPLDKNQRKRALEEGPLPFLFNMRAAEAEKRYNMTLQAEDENRYLVMIKPLLKEDQDTFSTAWVYLDKNFLLPTRIYLRGPDGHSSKDFVLSDIKANKSVDDRLFKGVNPNNYFKIERNPGGPAPATTAKGRRQQQKDQNARRPPAADADQPR
jgi:TIGR03009 family protein